MRGVNPHRDTFDAIPPYGSTFNRAAITRQRRAQIVGVAARDRIRRIRERESWSATCTAAAIDGDHYPAHADLF